MILLHWFFVCYFLTAASAEPLRYLLSGAGVVLVALILMVTFLTVNDFVERRGGVKIILLREGWLTAVERWLNSGSNASMRDRSVSISYETLGTGGNFSGEEFQNTVTFIVVRSSVFAKSSAQKAHLARDAYNAYSRRGGRRQVHFMQCKCGRGNVGNPRIQKLYCKTHFCKC